MASVLLDEGLPLRTAQWLRNLEIDALHAREAELTSAPDAEVLAFARNQRRACFTLDHDFHSILAETGATTRSVVLLRVQHTNYIEVGQLIVRYLKTSVMRSIKGLLSRQLAAEFAFGFCR
jgi:predicted nuclease of predicted toxin-antitoxin system